MKRIFSILILCLVVVVIWMTYPTSGESRPKDLQPGYVPCEAFDYPQPTVADTIDVPLLPALSEERIRKFTVRWGDNFPKILNRIGIPRPDINLLSHQIESLIDLREFQVGNKYQVHYNEAEEPMRLVYEADVRDRLVLSFRPVAAQMIQQPIITHIKSTYGVITSSLTSAVLAAGAPEDLADKILTVLAWKVDFRNLKRNDQFRVIYEEQTVEGEVIGSGKVLALHFTHDGTHYAGYGFDNGDGWEYFDENGINHSHSPLICDRITSLYSKRRFHPVKRRYRSHLGMDFEAEIGTPIEAIDDGVVIDARYGRANGNFVKIRHNKDLMTQYLHMSRIDSLITKGVTVKKGQKIGEVGSTGLSSGPHLCLRVWYKNRQQDPLKFAFPRRKDIATDRKAAFEEQVAAYKKDLADPIL
ncbi:peptidoglycan DD-metalloendopeptidase family protein [Marinoscillum furvescens]|uniref:Murein DD-endopeptidase MepM/ murein hydrolase activator NlpD n=1 Tax=Marinoscillum furvescens DSM 4134 TaxID=1122208 RepID=A0A3D9L0K3_MARFU|nr:peptidoglycan DD-metalloendopeptidase family protein [Marinoscillum furvescens]RED94396.1 murein DD-endopeptidase MepM/ murein hydrolase activator NlpD [Marinoscillum furvescens DSM 4134]